MTKAIDLLEQGAAAAATWLDFILSDLVLPDAHHNHHCQDSAGHQQASASQNATQCSTHDHSTAGLMGRLKSWGMSEMTFVMN